MSDYEIGHLEARQDAHEARLVEIRAEYRQDIARLEGKIDALLEWSASLKGSEKTLFKLLTASTMIAGGTVELLRWAHLWGGK